jgi:hypothetical protein
MWQFESGPRATLSNAHVLVRVPCGAPWMDFAFRLNFRTGVSANSDVGQHSIVLYPGKYIIVPGSGTRIISPRKKSPVASNLEGFDIPERIPVIRKR